MITAFIIFVLLILVDAIDVLIWVVPITVLLGIVYAIYVFKKIDHFSAPAKWLNDAPDDL